MPSGSATLLGTGLNGSVPQSVQLCDGHNNGTDLWDVMRTGEREHVKVSPGAWHVAPPLRRVTGSFHLHPPPPQKTQGSALFYDGLALPTPAPSHPSRSQVAHWASLLGTPDRVKWESEHISLSV